MIDAAKRYRHAIVIGGGLLGLEAANGLVLRGMDVTVIHLMPWLMERQLDRTAANLLQASLEAKGLTFRLETKTEQPRRRRVGARRRRGASGRRDAALPISS
jgi:nitrite reductase (NADH) large subunit